jgi:sarcosine oxidase
MRVVVVGLGAAGCAAAASLADAGHEVVGLDRHGVPNPVGSSHGRSRIFRLAYHEGARYLPLLRRSLAAWRRLDDARERPGALFRQTGSLALGPPDGETLAGARETCRRHDLPHEVLTGPAASDRFPAWSLDDEWRALFQPDGGLLDPERCLTALAAAALDAGATLRAPVAVEAVRETGGGVRVETGERRHDADAAVVAAGPWTGRLVPALADLLTVERHVHARVRTPDPSFVAPDRFPVFVADTPDGQHFYGLPAHRVPGVKVGATDADEPGVDPDSLARPAPGEEAPVTRFVDERLGGGTPLAASSCPLTQTPDGDYLVDHAPDADRVVVAAGLSGHGFKTAPAVGDLAAALAVGAEPPVDPAPFALARL